MTKLLVWSAACCLLIAACSGSGGDSEADAQEDAESASSEDATAPPEEADVTSDLPTVTFTDSQGYTFEVEQLAPPQVHVSIEDAPPGRVDLVAKGAVASVTNTTPGRTAPRPPEVLWEVAVECAPGNCSEDGGYYIFEGAGIEIEDTDYYRRDLGLQEMPAGESYTVRQIESVWGTARVPEDTVSVSPGPGEEAVLPAYWRMIGTWGTAPLPGMQWTEWFTADGSPVPGALTGAGGDDTGDGGNAGGAGGPDVSGEYQFHYPPEFVEVDPAQWPPEGFQVNVACDADGVCDVSGWFDVDTEDYPVNSAHVTRTEAVQSGDTVTITSTWDLMDDAYGCSGGTAEGTTVLEFDGDGGVSLVSNQPDTATCGQDMLPEVPLEGALVE